ncbi:hypothetical protein BCR44DRAFT_1153357 [Catenaria anguillulae PL171]|uniref:Uncharacterized protein n=1 Tax=Catenaria anguillulae PL171 TaxID=765915 RepID=A0A1Y2HIJ2_9FUNG|nr:hypothetical protein BCR44DRAFT_1153357 [Catenaria anguillulae PL171]
MKRRWRAVQMGPRHRSGRALRSKVAWRGIRRLYILCFLSVLCFFSQPSRSRFASRTCWPIVCIGQPFFFLSSYLLAVLYTLHSSLPCRRCFLALHDHSHSCHYRSFHTIRTKLAVDSTCLTFSRSLSKVSPEARTYKTESNPHRLRVDGNASILELPHVHARIFPHNYQYSVQQQHVLFVPRPTARPRHVETRDEHEGQPGQNTVADRLQELYKLIDGIGIAMVTSRRPRDGRLVSRALCVGKRVSGVDLAFIIPTTSKMVDDIKHDPHCNAAFYRDRTGEWLVSPVLRLSVRSPTRKAPARSRLPKTLPPSSNSSSTRGRPTLLPGSRKTRTQSRHPTSRCCSCVPSLRPMRPRLLHSRRPASCLTWACRH